MTERWQEPLSKKSCEDIIESSVRITKRAMEFASVTVAYRRTLRPLWGGTEYRRFGARPRTFGNPVDRRCCAIANPVRSGTAESRTLWGPVIAFGSMRRIFGGRGGWPGRMRPFYRDGEAMNLLHLNDRREDLDQHYGDATFKDGSGPADTPQDVSAHS